MGLDRYRLLAQLGAGADGVSYRALSEDGETEVEVHDLSAARRIAGRWGKLVPRLRTAAELVHPSSIRVLELGLEDDQPYAVMEWVGVTTLTEAVRTGGPKSRHQAMQLIRAIAGALRAAHRLGLPHGRLGPGQVLLTGEIEPKLDFTGTEVGFPGERELSSSADVGNAGNAVASTGADIYRLGSLLAWLMSEQNDQTDQGRFGGGLASASSLEHLARELLADDPSERPTAREVQERLDELLSPLDATGNWTTPGTGRSQSSVFARSARADSNEDCSGAGTLILDQGALRLGRYRLLEKLGEGAQGVVHRALDPADGSIVAIKIVRTDRVDNPGVLRRFRKEARLMAEANNPYVVNLLEFNEDDGIPYMVLEFVAGDSLGQLLAERTRLTEKEALSHMAAVARGLMEAHERGIVHRDIKPSNILLLDSRRLAEGAISTANSLVHDGEHKSGLLLDTHSQGAKLAPSLDGTLDAGTARPRVKISDFGLARHVVDTESLALTAAGALVGTPHYMAPEQWTGRGVDPRTDVYAMGATLFHLLTGQPPFTAGTREDLGFQHCNDAPPKLTSLDPGFSEAVERVVERALCKQPDDRYHDAGAMLRDIEALLHGRPSDLAVHPRLPECDPRRVVDFEFRWELESSPRQLWPLVTNTDRLDRAIGFAPVTYTTRYEPGRGVRTFAEGSKAGMVEVGEEHPYEWIEPRRMGVLREYSQGPFRWMVSVVELTPRPGGGTTLFHRLRLEPSSWKIRVGSRWGVGVSLRKSLERVYRRIDATVKSQSQRAFSGSVDPFEEPNPIPAVKRQRLERLLDRLVEQGVEAQIVDRFGEHLAFAPPQEVARMRPLALAQRWGFDPEQVANACLLGAREGLLELHWDLLCPACRISCEVKDTLRAIADHAHCAACHLDFTLDFAKSIELIFRAHPEIRAADLGTYCVGGPAHSPHVLAQIRVAPNERIELELELQAGSYRLRGPQLPWSIDFQVEKLATIRRWDIDLGSAQPPERVNGLRAGGQVLILNNPHPGELVIRIERTATRDDALTAAHATSMPLFRELFPGEVLAPGQLATVSMVTLLVTALDPQQADALYNDLGDVHAFSVIHEHIQHLVEAIRAGGGAVVKTMGEGVLASFNDVEAAVKTALELVPRPGAAPSRQPLRLRVGIHRGTTLAATLNDQLDYFGTTARQAVATLQHARAGELVLTQPVAADPAVASLLNARHIEGELIPANLAGHTHLIRIQIERFPLPNPRESFVSSNL
jgi:eukaryotic-like serine/threonine-protein kinase